MRCELALLAVLPCTALASLCSVTRYMVEPFTGDCSVAETCLRFLANTGWRDHGINGDGPTNANGGFGANSGAMSNDGFLANSGSMNDGFMNDGFMANSGAMGNDGFSSNSGFSGNDGFGNGGFAGNDGLMSNSGFNANSDFFDGNAGFLNDPYIGFLESSFGAEGGEANQGYKANSPYSANTGFFELQPFIEEAGYQANQGFWAKGGFFYLGLCSPAIECGEYQGDGAFGTCYDSSPNPACDPLFRGDGICDEFCNTPEFNMDDGDCIQENQASQREDVQMLKFWDLF